MISRRHIRLNIALLLPLMVLRAMLPAGYMPVAEQGRLRMVMCSAGVQLPATDKDSNTDKHPGPHGVGDCLFAQNASGAPPAQRVVAIIDPPAEFSFPATGTAELAPSTGPPRAAAARAPPALS